MVEPSSRLKRTSLIASLGYAVDGVLRTLCTQRNMKLHWLSGTAVMMVGMALNLDIASRSGVMFCVFVVICMEVLNTALEAFVDLHVKEYQRTAMVAKDAAAAAVLVLALGAMVVLADVLFHAWRMVEASTPAIIRTVILGVPLLLLEGAVLTLSRRVWRVALFTAIEIGLLSILAWYSRDEIFSLGALSFICSAAYARSQEPRLLA